MLQLAGGEDAACAGPGHAPAPQAGMPVWSWCGLETQGVNLADFPVTAMCGGGCGCWIIRDRPSSPWRHRKPDEPPITGPADEEGWATT